MIVTKITYTVVGAFFLSLIGAEISGNDKFPFIVIFILGLNFLTLILNFIIVMDKPSEKRFLFNMGLNLSVIILVAGYLYLVRAQFIDSIFSF